MIGFSKLVYLNSLLGPVGIELIFSIAAIADEQQIRGGDRDGDSDPWFAPYLPCSILKVQIQRGDVRPSPGWDGFSWG